MNLHKSFSKAHSLIVIFSMSTALSALHSCKTTTPDSNVAGKIVTFKDDSGVPIRIHANLAKYIGIPTAVSASDLAGCTTLSAKIKSRQGDLYLTLPTIDQEGNCSQTVLEINTESKAHQDTLVLYQNPSKIGFRNDLHVVGLIKVSPDVFRNIRAIKNSENDTTPDRLIEEKIAKMPSSDIELFSLCNEKFERRCDFVISDKGLLGISYNL